MEHFGDPSARVLDRRNRLTEAQVEAAATHYAQEVESRTHGPQLEGLENSHLKEALRSDANVMLVELQTETGEKVHWPLLTPVEHHIDYSQAFFDDRFKSKGEEVYYFSLPPFDAIDSLRGSEQLKHVATTLRNKNALVALDFLDEGENGELVVAFLEEMMSLADTEIDDITPSSHFGDPEGKYGTIDYGLPKVAHFETRISIVEQPAERASSVAEAHQMLIAEGKAEREPVQGPTLLTRELLLQNDGKYLEQIVAMYAGQFETLTKDHPSLQQSPEEELREMLLDEEALNVGYLEDGEVVGLCYFVQNIEKAVWLNADYYHEMYDDDEALHFYFPGIVVRQDKAHQGLQYMPEMLTLAGNLLQRLGEDLIITFQCTNISLNYIPDMVVAAATDHPAFEVAVPEQPYKQIGEYDYRIFRLAA